MRKKVALFSLGCALGIGASHAALTFTVSFTAQALLDLSVADQAKFTDGMGAWDAVIEGHRDGVDRTWNLVVDTFSTAASGGGVILGSAGPSALILSNVVPGSGLSAPFADQFILSSGGNANFNIHPDAGTLQAATIRHEIGHALGVGTLWEDNEVYNDGDAGTGNRTLAGGFPGQYMGAAGLAAYQAEFDMTATFVPVELDGGAGTANGHWNEALDNFAVENGAGTDGDPGDGAFPGPSTSGGLFLDDELMSGVLSGSAFMSNTTIQQLFDIGFNPVPIPEPGAGLLCGTGLLLLGLRRRRRQ